ncbi:MAG: PaaI family thioesterase [Desulfobacterota bacterium]|nr:PaaI family thioesterase [Thermodesulfobacteriota bacterium]
MNDDQLNPAYKEAVAKVVNRSPYFSLLSMAVKELRWGRSFLEVELAEKHLQPFGNVHGGAIASLVDAATFWATFPQVEKGHGLTTVEIKVNYLAPAQKGRLLAEGLCLKIGKTLALGEAFVRNEEGKLIAHGTSTMMVLPGLTVPGYEDLPPARP